MVISLLNLCRSAYSSLKTISNLYKKILYKCLYNMLKYKRIGGHKKEAGKYLAYFPATINY